MGHSGMLVIENQRSDWLASVVSEKLRLSFSHLRLLTNLSFLRMIDCTKLANVLQRRTTQEISRKISCGLSTKTFQVVLCFVIQHMNFGWI